jgi:pSer/pThr/pTyr-binding forkhead associated (FHA) protein
MGGLQFAKILLTIKINLIRDKKMAYIILKQQDESSHTKELTPGEITLGRSPGNHVHIDNITVSSHHARIFTYFCVSYIEDLNSTNGTFVNGKPVKKHILHPGDVVTLGKYEFVVENERAASAISQTG